MAEQQHPRQNSSLAKPVKKLCATLARTVMMEGNSIPNQLNVVNRNSSQPYLNKGNSRFCGKNAQSMLSKSANADTTIYSQAIPVSEPK